MGRMYCNTKTATRYPRLLGYILNHRQDIAFSEVARINLPKVRNLRKVITYHYLIKTILLVLE